MAKEGKAGNKSLPLPPPVLLTVVGMALQPLSPFLNMTELCIETVQLKQGLGPLRAVKPTAEKPVL